MLDIPPPSEMSKLINKAYCKHKKLGIRSSPCWSNLLSKYQRKRHVKIYPTPIHHVVLDIYPTPMIMLYYVKQRHSAFRMSMRYHTRIKNIYLWIIYGQSRNDFGKFTSHTIIQTLCVPDRIKHLNFLFFFLSKTLFENIPVSEKFNHLTLEHKQQMGHCMM